MMMRAEQALPCLAICMSESCVQRGLAFSTAVFSKAGFACFRLHPEHKCDKCDCAHMCCSNDIMVE